MTAERYTAVFTVLLSVKKPGEYLYLAMSEDPRGPGGSGTLRRGRPPYELLGARSRSEIYRRGADVWYSMLTGNCGACEVTAQISWGI